MDPVPHDRAYVTLGQAARMLGVSPSTLDRWANNGRIRHAVTLGGHRRFRTDVIQAVALSMGLEPSGQGDGAGFRKSETPDLSPSWRAVGRRLGR